MSNPTIGRIVHLRLSAQDAEAINRRRADYAAYRRVVNGIDGADGRQFHVGNDVREGDYYPAIVVRTFGEHATVVNLKVLLDGNDDYWATSRAEGDEPGFWAWPARD